MVIKDFALECIGAESAALALAQSDDDIERLAGLVVAARILQEKAAASLAGRISETELEEAKAAALAELGW